MPHRVTAMFIAFLVVLALRAPGAAGAPLDHGAALPTTMCRDYFLVHMTLAPRDAAPEDPDVRTLTLLFDTGASTTLVDPASLERVTGRAFASGDRVQIHDIHAGPAVFRTLSARVRPMGHISLALGRDIDGILGFDAFRDALVTLDYPAQRLRVGIGDLPPPDGREVLRFHGDGRPFVHVRIGGRRRSMLLDSGSGGGFSINDGRSIDWVSPPLALSAAMRINRLEVQRTGRLRGEASLGSLAFLNPLCRLSGGGSQLIGTEVLRHFVLTFDQANRRVRMVAATDGPVRMPALTGPGAAFRPTPEGLEVVFVAPDTPAGTAGVLVGDLVLAINGEPVPRRRCAGPTLGDAGVFVYTLLRDAARLELVVEHDVLVP